nr:MAG TPA: PcfJ like protein [Caudoviricetes sp.]
MKTLFGLQVDKLYDVIRRQQIGDTSPAIYHHVDCGQSFNCLWPTKYRGMEYGPDPAYADKFYCPHCGKLLNMNNMYVAEAYGSQSVPTNIDLSIIDRGQILDVKFEYSYMMIDSDYLIVRVGQKPHVIDVVRFDFKKRKVYLVQKRRTASDIVNELECEVDDFQLYPLPIQWLVAHDKCRLYEHRPKFKEFGKVLKEAFFQKLSKKVGYKVKPFRSGVQLIEPAGSLKNLLHNLAWKMVAPDGPAINQKLQAQYQDYRAHFLNGKMNVNAFYRELAKGLPFVDALVQGHQLPNVRWVRRLLTESPFLYAQLINTVGILFLTMDYKKALIDWITKESKTNDFHLWALSRIRSEKDPLAKFVRIICHNWGERKALLFFKSAKSYNDLRDTANMYFELSRDKRKLLWASRVQLKTLHDTVMHMRDFEKHENLPVQQTDFHRVLEDTCDGLVFVPVGTTHEVIALGHELNNCVSTYLKRVKRGDCAIVGVYKNQKPVACIEVRPVGEKFKEIAQAKIVNNKGVREDETVNQAVLAWMQDKKLTAGAYMRDIALGGMT